eukprot:TRINITY_DN6989_c0_g1_i1.p3 TRINITY_DN6989_c0_g1~~TRINITY_DN6989_c0_g1_i1.p3  ORF type:complete len:134 (-),score=41.09 TRINITY_DN6989_c0_g1_i1:127-528(-)
MHTLRTQALRTLLAASRTRRFSAPATISVTFVTPKGEVALRGEVGKSLMEVGRDNDIDIEAACDGTCACSTCHVYVDAAQFERLPEASEDELDMLDLALDVRPTSRLSCQIKLTPETDGIVATLPSETLNQQY